MICEIDKYNWSAMSWYQADVYGDSHLAHSFPLGRWTNWSDWRSLLDERWNQLAHVDVDVDEALVEFLVLLCFCRCMVFHGASTSSLFFSTVSDLRGAVEEVLPTLSQQGVRVFILGEGSDLEGAENLSDKIRQASDQPLSRQLRAGINATSPALYIYTSGTTGDLLWPRSTYCILTVKGFWVTELSKSNSLNVNVFLSGLPKAAVINHERLWMTAFLQTIAGVRSDDVIYIYLPLYHSAGFLMGLCGAIDKGNAASYLGLH